MKALFKKNVNGWVIVGLFVLLLGILSLSFLTKYFYILWILWFPLMMYVLRGYLITDKDELWADGRIKISLITRLEYREKGVAVFYTKTAGGEEKMKFLKPGDPDRFVLTLSDINTKIDVE